MFRKEIHTLLHKSLSAMSLPLPMLVCQRSLHHDIDDLMEMVFPRMKLAVVADYNTEKALGAKVFRALKTRFSAKLVFLGNPVMADLETAQWVATQTSHCDALVAVGSGTINDLCKYAAFTSRKPYMVFPTAASMNGYLSANASISENGYKKTMKAQMPQAVFCDLETIAAAPIRLAKSGLGDSLARPTAQADWLMSHLVLGTPYNETPFTLLHSIEPDLFDNARGIAKADPKTIELLMHTLLLSGLGMTIAGGSYPASQGEHMIAHAYEMLNNAHAVPTLHGEEIGVTTLAMARLQEAALHSPLPLWQKVRQKEQFDSDAMISLFGEQVTKEAKKSYKIKCDLIKERLDSRFRENDNSWEKIAAAIEKITLPSDKILAILQAAEAPDTTQALGWNDANYQAAFTHAKYLRERFTFLDIK